MKSDSKQERASVNLEQIAYVTILRLADELSWDTVELLKSADLTSTQYNVLRILKGAGADGLPCHDIGERLINRDPDVTRLLDRMEKRGLVERARQVKDRRVITVQITTAGLQLLKQFDKPVEAMHREQFKNLSPSQIKTLIDLLDKILVR
jgi:DNA-binding MarR family transcriptional regulator